MNNRWLKPLLAVLPLLLTLPVFSQQKSFENNLKHHPVRQNGYWVVSNTSLPQGTLTHYDTIFPVRFEPYAYFVFGRPYLCDTLWQAKLHNGKYDLYSITGLKINTKTIDSVQVNSDRHLIVWNSGSMGLVRRDLKYLEPRFSDLQIYELNALNNDLLQPNIAVVTRSGPTYGFLSADGTLLKSRFASIEPDPRNNGLFLAGKSGKEGFIHPVTGSLGLPRKGILTIDSISPQDVFKNPAGTWLPLLEKDSVSEMNLYGETRPLKYFKTVIKLDMKKTRRFGLYARPYDSDSSGWWLTEPKFRWIRPVSGDYYLVSRGKRKGLYNVRGQKIIPVEMEKIHCKDPRMIIGWGDRTYFMVRKNRHLGVYCDIPGKGGQLFIPIEYDGVYSIQKENQFVWRVRKNQRYGLVSYDGKYLFEVTHDYTDVSLVYCDSISHGVCMAYDNGIMITKTFSSKYPVTVTDVSEKLPVSVFVDHYNSFAIFKSDGLWYLHHYDSLFTVEFDTNTRYNIAYGQYLLKDGDRFTLIQHEKYARNAVSMESIFSMNVPCNRYWIYTQKHWHRTRIHRPLPKMRRIRRMRHRQQTRKICLRD